MVWKTSKKGNRYNTDWFTKKSYVRDARGEVVRSRTTNKPVFRKSSSNNLPYGKWKSGDKFLEKGGTPDYVMKRVKYYRSKGYNVYVTENKTGYGGTATSIYARKKSHY